MVGLRRRAPHPVRDAVVQIADGGVAEVSTAQVGMITDPLLNGWYDVHNGEVGDLCHAR